MKRLFSTLFIICMITAVGFTLNSVTKNRTSQGCIQLTDFYRLPEQTVDVLCIGSSHVYYSIHAPRLYDRYGMAAYLLASPGQPVWISYYFLEEALKTQSPRLVVFDVCTLYRREADAGSASWPSLISMKLSVRKWKAIRAVNQEGKQLDSIAAFFSFPYYHTRYDELNRQDYENTKRVRYNGYFPSFERISESELSQWKDADRTNPGLAEPLAARAETYLRRLIELCQKKELPLLLVNSPYLNQTLEKQKAYNYVSLIAQEYGVPYLDGNYIEEMQIDFKEDLLEASHLNYFGSIKYTDYLAGWMKQHYLIPDRRGNAGYRSWEETSRKFRHQQLYTRVLKQIQTQKAYLEAVQQLDECTVVFYDKKSGAAAVCENGKKVFEGAPDSDYFRHFDLGYSDLAVGCSSGNLSVRLDRKEYLFAQDGLNVLVYDKIAKRVIDGAGFTAGKRAAAKT